jgi:uncharacterized membrane protein YqaE (UPF0057 family)
VFLKVALGLHFIINIVLKIRGVIPGMIQAIQVICRKEREVKAVKYKIIG